VRVLPLSLLLCIPSLLPQPASALSLNPLDYYEVDYRIAVSHTVVEPDEAFSVAVSADIRCIKDMPFGVDEATGVASVLARHTTSDLELTLLDSYEVTIDSVPDWEGDEYQLDESMDLAFPSDAPEGVYELVARLDRVSLDGWNVTALIPGSYRTFGIASIMCATEDAPPAPPAPEPGTLRVAVLGHDFRPSLDADGILLDGVDADLIEGEVTLLIEAGTSCEDSSGDALAYIAVAEDPTPPAYAYGIVVAAFTMQPSGAQFSPAIELGIAYGESALPDTVDAASLMVAWYDQQAGLWRELDTIVDAQRRVAYADVVHFSSVALLAPTAAPGPASFAVRDLTATPAQVAPLGKVLVSVTAENTGGTRGTYHLAVSLNDESAYEQDLVLGPRESRTVRFVLARSQPGVYRVEAAGLTSEFTVLAPAATAGGADVDDPPASSSGSTTPASNTNEQVGMHPVYIALLALAGVAFMTLVVLVLAGVL
jgi:hypothetical protein